MYSYSADSLNDVAVMDFRSFYDAERMERFADSMFTDLREKNISNLIIDIRDNGGGHSRVGDILLRYISPEPFIQMDKALIRISPLTSKLMGDAGVEPMFVFQEVDTSQYIKPLSVREGHYTGNVYLLTSNKTFFVGRLICLGVQGVRHGDGRRRGDGRDERVLRRYTPVHASGIKAHRLYLLQALLAVAGG